jgi:hypothetical protein
MLLGNLVYAHVDAHWSHPFASSLVFTPGNQVAMFLLRRSQRGTLSTVLLGFPGRTVLTWRS